MKPFFFSNPFYMHAPHMPRVHFEKPCSGLSPPLPCKLTSLISAPLHQSAHRHQPLHFPSCGRNIFTPAFGGRTCRKQPPKHPFCPHPHAYLGDPTLANSYLMVEDLQRFPASRNQHPQSTHLVLHGMPHYIRPTLLLPGTLPCPRSCGPGPRLWTSLWRSLPPPSFQLLCHFRTSHLLHLPHGKSAPAEPTVLHSPALRIRLLLGTIPSLLSLVAFRTPVPYSSIPTHSLSRPTKHRTCTRPPIPLLTTCLLPPYAPPRLPLPPHPILVPVAIEKSSPTLCRPFPAV
jgi:hypothetical protein